MNPFDPLEQTHTMQWIGDLNLCLVGPTSQKFEPARPRRLDPNPLTSVASKSNGSTQRSRLDRKLPLTRIESNKNG